MVWVCLEFWWISTDWLRDNETKSKQNLLEGGAVLQCRAEWRERGKRTVENWEHSRRKSAVHGPGSYLGWGPTSETRATPGLRHERRILEQSRTHEPLQ